jgi:hypothetical protein
MVAMRIPAKAVDVSASAKKPARAMGRAVFKGNPQIDDVNQGCHRWLGAAIVQME